uniref:Uncharacterized protein n=1 Tax=viral metagenome TaxID=1070528 RepID=A0A6M3M9E3_9ZZZZ
MVTEFKVEGWWRGEEAAGAASALLSRHAAGDKFLNPPWSIRVKAATEDGMVRIIIDDDLSPEQITILRNYFENHPEQNMPDWERAELLAEKARREELVARVRKFTNGSEISMNVKDIRGALGAVAELVGVDLAGKEEN